jgi:hypothetical protein
MCSLNIENGGMGAKKGSYIGRILLKKGSVSIFKGLLLPYR